MTRIINSAGIELIKHFEGCRLESYQDGAGIWTIGYGHTKGVHKGQTCSQHQADAWLEADLVEAEEAVSRLVKVPLTDNQFAALVAFTFNLGEGRLAASTLLKRLNEGKYDQIPAFIRAWYFVNKKASKGLILRRAAEVELWSKP